MIVEGPGGSGRFYSIGIVVDGGDGAPPRYACFTGSTVAWRHLAPVADRLAPLTWFADLDHDGDHDLVVWQRKPWGGAEVTNALVPLVYRVEGDELIGDECLARPLRHRVADAYRALADAGGDQAACHRSIANQVEDHLAYRSHPVRFAH